MEWIKSMRCESKLANSLDYAKLPPLNHVQWAFSLLLHFGYIYFLLQFFFCIWITISFIWWAWFWTFYILNSHSTRECCALIFCCRIFSFIPFCNKNHIYICAWLIMLIVMSFHFILSWEWFSCGCRGAWWSKWIKWHCGRSFIFTLHFTNMHRYHINVKCWCCCSFSHLRE